MTTDLTTRSIELDEELVNRVERRLSLTEWSEPAEYIAFVLEEMLTEVESESEAEAEFDAVDEQSVKDRLESLGYLNE